MSFDSFQTSGNSPIRIFHRRASLRHRLLGEAPHSDSRWIDLADRSHHRSLRDAVRLVDRSEDRSLPMPRDAVCLRNTVGAGLQTGPIFAEAV